MQKAITMKRKLSLSEWAAVAELVGTIGVIISLVFLVVSINKSTAEAAADSTQAFYDSVQRIEMAVAMDAGWSAIVLEGRKQDARLSELEQFRYDLYVVGVLDNWDGLQTRFEDGLMDEIDLNDWDQYFANWARRHVSASTWDRIKWQYTQGIVPKLETAIAPLQEASN
jgi:hypothetical protein